MKPDSFGSLILFLSILSMAIGNSLTHALGCKYNASTILFYKSFLALIFLLIFMGKSIQRIFIVNNPKWLILRSCIGALGVYLWIPAIQTIPLNQASALSLTSSFFSAWGGYLFLKERASWIKQLSLIFGFLGAYLIIYPHMTHHIYFYPLASALCFGMSGTLTRYIARDYDEYTISFYLFFIMTFISAPFGMMFPLSLWDGFVLGCIGLLYGFSQVLYAKAYVYAEASYLAPFKYIKAPLHLLFGILFFKEIPDLYDLAGFLIIFISLRLLLKKSTSR